MKPRPVSARRDPVFRQPGPDGRFAVPGAAGEILLVPGTAAPLLPVDLPAALRGRVREQVAWRQLKDLAGLTPALQEMRPYGGSAAETWGRVLVVDSAQMREWRQQAGSVCRALLPDYLALPAAADLWVVVNDGGNVRVRQGLTDGFSAEADLALLLLQRALVDTGTVPRAVLFLEGELSGLAEVLSAKRIPVLHDMSKLAALGVSRPTVLSHGELAADLRIDAQAARARLRRRILPWRWPILAGLLAAGLWAAGQEREISRINQQTAELRRETDTLVRDHFLPTGPLLDVRAQVSRALATRQAEVAASAGRVSPLLLLGQVSDVIAASPADLRQISYQQDGGLEMELWLTDFATVDRLVGALVVVGVAATVREARVRDDSREGSGVRVLLTLRTQHGQGE